MYGAIHGAMSHATVVLIRNTVRTIIWFEVLQMSPYILDVNQLGPLLSAFSLLLVLLIIRLKILLFLSSSLP